MTSPTEFSVGAVPRLWFIIKAYVGASRNLCTLSNHHHCHRPYSFHKSASNFTEQFDADLQNDRPQGTIQLSILAVPETARSSNWFARLYCMHLDRCYFYIHIGYGIIFAYHTSLLDTRLDNGTKESTFMIDNMNHS